MTPTPTPETAPDLIDRIRADIELALDRNGLVEAGWDAESIDEAFATVTKRSEFSRKEAAVIMPIVIAALAASPQPVVAPSDLSGEDGLSKTIPSEQAGDVAPQRQGRVDYLLACLGRIANSRQSYGGGTTGDGHMDCVIIAQCALEADKEGA